MNSQGVWNRVNSMALGTGLCSCVSSRTLVAALPLPFATRFVVQGHVLPQGRNAIVINLEHLSVSMVAFNLPRLNWLPSTQSPVSFVMSITRLVLVHWSLQVAMETASAPLQGPNGSLF